MPNNFDYRILIQSGQDNLQKIIKMKTIITILSLMISTLCIQSCTNREEDIISGHNAVKAANPPSLMHRDSIKDLTQTPPTNPPVRDGDNWRSQ